MKHKLSSSLIARHLYSYLGPKAYFFPISIHTESSETRVWIGMTDLDQEMYYTWTDTTEVTYTNWAYYEPNNAGNEDCVEMWLERVSQLSNDIGARSMGHHFEWKQFTIFYRVK